MDELIHQTESDWPSEIVASLRLVGLRIAKRILDMLPPSAQDIPLSREKYVKGRPFGGTPIAGWRYESRNGCIPEPASRRLAQDEPWDWGPSKWDTRRLCTPAWCR